MTIKVTITHDQPDYDKAVEVQYMNNGSLGGHPPTTICPGGSAEFYVYDTQQLVVSESAWVKLA